MPFEWMNNTSNNDDVHCSVCFRDICMFIGPYFPLHSFIIWKLNKCSPLGSQWESQSLYENPSTIWENNQSGYKMIHHLSFVKLAEDSFGLCPWDYRQKVTITDLFMLRGCSPDSMEGGILQSYNVVFVEDNMEFDF